MQPAGIIFVLVALLVAGTRPSALSLGYAFSTFDIPGCVQVAARDINDIGQIAGYCDSGSWTSSRGYIRSSTGEITMVDYPGAVGTNVYGINDLGDVVGVYFPPTGPGYGAYPPQRPFVRVHTGDFIDLPDYPGTLNRTVPEDINDSGQIVGGYVNDPCWQGFVLDGGSFTVLGCDSRSINDNGWITGATGGLQRSFGSTGKLPRTTFPVRSTPAGWESTALAIRLDSTAARMVTAATCGQPRVSLPTLRFRVVI
jgi:hypothetical protein